VVSVIVTDVKKIISVVKDRNTGQILLIIRHEY
jgi:hypothetical protein